MLLTSVVLVLQETLEAAILVSVLAAITARFALRIYWLPLALVAGTLLALLYAANMRVISEWFDYVGQEIVNAALQGLLAIAIIGLTAALRPFNSKTVSPQGQRVYPLAAAVALALAITREGSEILVYLGGFLGHEEKWGPVLAGSLIGFGIGASLGFLIYYALAALRGRLGDWMPLLLLALFAGNMLAQSSLLLAQADLLPAGPALWDSSAWLPEDSLAGRLAYALLGYESRPSLTQAVSYVSGVCAVLAAGLIGRSQA